MHGQPGHYVAPVSKGCPVRYHPCKPDLRVPVIQHRATLDYGPIQGDADRRWQLSHLLLDRGLGIAPEAMFVTAGAQQGIDLTLCGLTDTRDVILVEEPTYPGVLEAAAQ